MERMTYRGSQGSNALTLEDPRSDSQDVPHRSESSTDFTSDDSIPLRLSDLREPDTREFITADPVKARDWSRSASFGS